MFKPTVKFFCTRCGEEVTEEILQLIESRCGELEIDPADLGERARETAKSEMLLELGEELPDPRMSAFMKATALLLLELVYSPALLCERCRRDASDEGPGGRAKLRLVKGGQLASS